MFHTMTSNPTLSHDEIIQAQIFKLVIIWNCSVRSVEYFFQRRIIVIPLLSIHTPSNVETDR